MGDTNTTPPDDKAGGEEIPNLSPDEMAIFVRAVDRLQKRRRIYLGAYLLSLVVAIVGLITTLVVYGRAERGAFVGWVMLVPLGVIGFILWIFGRWAKRV